jgi:hypothetical protein
MGVIDHLHVPAIQCRLIPGEIFSDAHWTWGWVGRCGVEKKFLPLPRIELRPSIPYPVNIPSELTRILLVFQYRHKSLKQETLISTQWLNVYAYSCLHPKDCLSCFCRTIILGRVGICHKVTQTIRRADLFEVLVTSSGSDVGGKNQSLYHAGE